MPKKKLILDTTICIDLFHAQLLGKATKLPYELVLPDVIVHELIHPPGELFIQSGFSALQLGENIIDRIVLLRERYSKPSTNDLFALLLAKINACPLVTGDDALRKAANEENVPVYGLLWFLDRLVDQKILTTNEAADALKKFWPKAVGCLRKSAKLVLKSGEVNHASLWANSHRGSWKGHSGPGCLPFANNKSCRLVFYGRNVEDATGIPPLVSKINSTLSQNALPMFFAIDQEEGIVHRLQFNPFHNLQAFYYRKIRNQHKG